jgi:two-component system, LytTR family, sensor kinase
MPKRISSDTLFKVLFHILFWGILIIFPLFFGRQKNFNLSKTSLSFTAILLVTGFNVVFFFVNSEWLIPKILHKKGVLYYVLSLFGLISVSFLILQSLRSFILNTDNASSFKSFAIVPLIIVSAVSTGYGLLAYFNDQEKLKQAQESERMQSELSFLRSQISPHFIFNVLNGLVYLIHKNSPDAKTVVVKLADLMRYMLYESDVSKVPLNTEIEYLQNYIDLQKLRFDDDVEVKCEISVSKSNYFIEPMLLIPFVENAFKHGVAMVQNPSISIKLHQEDEQLYFIVKNTVGQNPDEKKDNESGIGMKNVERRLELLYPQNHILTIKHLQVSYEVALELKLKS